MNACIIEKDASLGTLVLREIVNTKRIRCT